MVTVSIISGLVCSFSDWRFKMASTWARKTVLNDNTTEGFVQFSLWSLSGYIETVTTLLHVAAVYWTLQSLLCSSGHAYFSFFSLLWQSENKWQVQPKRGRRPIRYTTQVRSPAASDSLHLMLSLPNWVLCLLISHSLLIIIKWKRVFFFFFFLLWTIQ